MTRSLLFTKMEATGNDFVVVDNRNGQTSPDEWAALARRVSDRRFGIGSDGLILLEESVDGGLTMHYKNPDGSDAGMCGNGGRCFVRFALERGYDEPVRFRVHDKEYTGHVTDNETIRLDFPLETGVEPVRVDGENLYRVYTNTEHLVVPVRLAQLQEEEKLVKRGRALRNHPAFAPKGTNVNFIAGNRAEQVNLQTYERGVEALTLACGTGAIASALAWHQLKGGDDGEQSCRVEARGGVLKVCFRFSDNGDQYDRISLEGPARTVFTGSFPLPDTL
ncbi:MAG: diaminopimelate epimerase [Balneolaceae bacterium]